MQRMTIAGWMLATISLPARADCVAFVESKIHARNAKSACEAMRDSGDPRDFGDPREFETARSGPTKDAPIVYIFKRERRKISVQGS